MNQENWRIVVYPAFEEIRQRLLDDVSKIKAKDPIGYKNHKKVKFLKRLNFIMFKEIPLNPMSYAYLQGNTLGSEYRHWKRAKLFTRFRLFFRFNSEQKIILYAWLNDDNSLRNSGSKNDPYHIFSQRLRKGRPPNDWEDLLRESSLITEANIGYY